MKRKAKSEISDSAAKALKLQTRFVIIKMPVRQVIHSYLSSFLYPASTGSCFMKARQRKEKTDPPVRIHTGCRYQSRVHRPASGRETLRRTPDGRRRHAGYTKQTDPYRQAD